MYNRLLKKSFHDIFKNVNVFLPDIIGLITTFALGAAAFYLSGLSFLITDNGLGNQENFLNLITSILTDTGNIVKISLSLVGFIITTFLIGASLQVAKYVMFKEVINKKKPGFFRSLFYGNRKYYWRFIGMKIAVFMNFALGFLIALLIGLIFITLSKTLAAVVFGVIFLLLFIYLMLHMFFVFPILILDEKGVKESMKISFRLVKENKKKTFNFFLIGFLLYGGFWLATSLLLFPMKDFNTFNIGLGAFFGLIPILIVGDFPFLPPLWQWQTGYYGFLAYRELKDKGPQHKPF